LDHYLKLSNSLSAIIVWKNIEISDKKLLCEKIIGYFRRESLGGQYNMMKVYHKLKGHHPNSIRLNCGSLHCFECYFDIISESRLNGPMKCSCDKIIQPKYIYQIIQKYEHFQTLKIRCVLCDKTDLAYFGFSLRGLHKCQVCTECILKRYKLEKNVPQRCPLCDEIYNGDCNNVLRVMKSETEDPDLVKNFFKGECHFCATEGDSRTFQTVCESLHTACPKCLKNLKDSHTEHCICGLQISLLR
jgi:hypothetical protein